MASSSISLGDTSRQALLIIYGQLQLLARRNKNQHRLTKWWASLGMLRRHLGRIVQDLESIATLENLKDLNWDERRERRIGLEQKMKMEALFIRDILGPKCYMAFSAVIADNQYLPIGLMLMASLAQLHKLLRPLAPLSEPEKDLACTRVIGSVPGIIGEYTGDFDIGEKIARSPTSKVTSVIELETSGSDGSTSTGKSEKRALTGDTAVMNNSTIKLVEKRKKKKKKRTGGDAFDDLFSGLL